MIWYLSFSLPKEEGGWQGFCLVNGVDSEIEAIAEAHRLGINPGGEVLAMTSPTVVIPEEWMNKLFTTKEDAEAFDKAMGGKGDVVKATADDIEQIIECSRSGIGEAP
jgi:hypothetical protein